MDDIEEQAGREARMLEWMKELNNPHLIKTIAYYKVDGKHHFVFRWAEHGSLRKFWETDPQRPDSAYVEWVFNQLQGLAKALKLLHQPVPKKMCRHGDLKPDNVLCFNDSSNKLILVIADLGLSTVHQEVTEERRAKGLITSITSGTKKYLGPEADPDPLMPKSRRYDVWALGCIYLEFVIWLLYGVAGLERLRGPLEKRYYDLDRKSTPLTPYVHKDVKTWIDHIKNEKCCPAKSAIWHLVDLISTKMLIVDINHYHKDDPGHPDKLEKTETSSSLDSGPLSDEPKPSQFKMNVRTPTVGPASNDARPRPPYDSSVPYRWTSHGICEELERIIQDVKSGNLVLMDFAEEPSEGPALEKETNARMVSAVDVSGFLAVRPHNLVR